VSLSGDDAVGIASRATGLLIIGNGVDVGNDNGDGGEGVHDNSRGRLVRASRTSSML